MTALSKRVANLERQLVPTSRRGWTVVEFVGGAMGEPIKAEPDIAYSTHDGPRVKRHPGEGKADFMARAQASLGNGSDSMQLLFVGNAEALNA